jgi:hypothetical protein
MFEGKPPHPPEPAVFGTPAEKETLRPLAWGDLVARLEAARGLREELYRDAGWEGANSVASFDARCARAIARQGKGKQDVNPTDLANGKRPACNSDAADVAGIAPRGNR